MALKRNNFLDLQRLHEFYSEEGLEVPFLPDPLKSYLRQVKDTIPLWVTQERFLGDFVETTVDLVKAEVIENPQPFLLIGLDGYEENCWYWHYFLADEFSVILTSVCCGAFDGDRKSIQALLKKRDHFIQALMQQRAALQSVVRWPEGKRLLVVSNDRNPTENGRGWIQIGTQHQIHAWTSERYPFEGVLHELSTV